MKVKAIIFIAMALLMAVWVTPVYANDIPPLPHAFYGDLIINDSPAPAGTTVEARGDGVRAGTEGNPIVTTQVGSYGSSNPLEDKLIVQGDIADGATLTFYVNDVSTGQTAEWHSGDVTELALSVTIAAPPAGGGGGGAPAMVTLSLTGLVATLALQVDSQGIVQSTCQLETADGKLTLDIAKDTKLLDSQENPLASLSAALEPSPPEPPPDEVIVMAYDLGPDGATFSPAIGLTIEYDPDALPEGVAEEDLVVAYYDEAAAEWVELDCVVDTENDTITASVSHFTTFAIIARIPPAPAPALFSVSNLSVKPAEVEPKEAVTIAVSLANTGGTEGSYTVVLKLNGVKEAEKSVTLAAGGSEIVSFSVTREETGSYSVTVDGLSASFTVAAPPEEEEEIPEEVPAKPPINWPLIGGVIAAVVVVGLLIFFLVVRRRAV